MKRLLFVLACLIPFVIHAQTIKTDVLVIGKGDAALTAALQSSKSGVKTLILTQDLPFDLNKLRESKSKEILKIYEEAEIKRTASLLSLSSADTHKKKKNEPKSKVDSSTLLRFIDKLQYRTVDRSGSGWELKLEDAQSIKAKVLILADDPQKLYAALKISALKPAEVTPLSYADNLYRTSVAGAHTQTASFLSLYNLLLPDQDNLLFIPPADLKIAQAAGATAAYAAFYQTKTSVSSLKRIQGELLSYKMSLMPLEDITPADSNWLAIQKVGLTGIIKAELKDGKAYFNPEKIVTYEEIKQPIKDYYYKAQIWFDDHQSKPIDLEATISMVCYVGNKAVEATKTELQKKWNKNYKFTSKYDPSKTLTRREFAVIINDYLKPFDDINVDRTGRVIR